MLRCLNDSEISWVKRTSLLGIAGVEMQLAGPHCRPPEWSHLKLLWSRLVVLAMALQPLARRMVWFSVEAYLDRHWQCSSPCLPLDFLDCSRELDRPGCVENKWGLRRSQHSNHWWMKKAVKIVRNSAYFWIWLVNIHFCILETYQSPSHRWSGKTDGGTPLSPTNTNELTGTKVGGCWGGTIRNVGFKGAGAEVCFGKDNFLLGS